MKSKRGIALFGALFIVAAMLYGCASDTVNSGGADEDSAITAQSKIINADYRDMFGAANGCMVLFSTKENAYTLYNEPLCRTQVSPDSVFKIVSALMGVHNGVVAGEESTMGYEGRVYPIEAWNQNITFKDAFQSSCVWYFRKIIDTVGQEEVKRELELLSYGNCDISQWEGSGLNPFPETNGFWLESSLKISPLEQAEVLKKILEGETVYTAEEISLLKKLMYCGETGAWTLYGKTGTGNGAWFAGWTEHGEERLYFATYLKSGAAEQAVGDTAKEITQRVLNSIQS